MHLARVAVAATISLCILAGACGESSQDPEPAARASAADATATPEPPPPPSCDEAREISDKIFAASLVASEAEGAGFRRITRTLGRHLERAILLVNEVESYLENYGPFDAGDACLSAIASAEAVSVASIGLGEDQAASAYDLLLRFYPDSDAADEAEAFLKEHSYPLPD